VGLELNRYIIQAGDSFFRLAKQNGCSWQDVARINPGLDPYRLQIGQVINLPVSTASGNKASAGAGGCNCSAAAGKGYGGRCDDILVEVEGVRFRVVRAGEASVPHEVHLILPRTEIHKVEHPQTGVIETSIMISNINIVNSPRFHGEGPIKINVNPQNN